MREGRGDTYSNEVILLITLWSRRGREDGGERRREVVRRGGGMERGGEMRGGGFLVGRSGEEGREEAVDIGGERKNE